MRKAQIGLGIGRVRCSLIAQKQIAEMAAQDGVTSAVEVNGLAKDEYERRHATEDVQEENASVSHSVQCER